MQRKIVVPVIMVLAAESLLRSADEAQKSKTQKKTVKSPAKTSAVSYKKNVFPIIKMNCLPCHTEDNMNQSELYLDTYENMMKGGKHGKSIFPGKGDSSLIVQKLIPPP